MEDKRSKLLAGIFTGYILLFSLSGFAVTQKTFSTSENRYLAQKPEFQWDSLLDGSFASEYDLYLSDQFPVRDYLVGLKATAERIRGKKDVNGVYLGKDSYLIERFDPEQMETDQSARNLERLGEFVRSVGERIGDSHIKVMLVPSASQILTERLPFLAAPYDQSGVTDQLASILYQKGVAEHVLIPVEQKLKNADDQEIYYRTDHHWTALGAYYGYSAWAESMGFTPWPERAFEVRTVSRNFYGTVHSKLNIPWRADTIRLYMPVQKQNYQVYYDGGGVYQDTLYNERALDGKDQYAVYLDGNHGLTKIVNQDAAGERKDKNLLIIKDSYAHSFAPFAVNHYGTVYMADLRYLNIDLGSFLEENRITEVLVLYQIPGFVKDRNIFKMKVK